jgi:hypothetical protein
MSVREDGQSSERTMVRPESEAGRQLMCADQGTPIVPDTASTARANTVPRAVDHGRAQGLRHAT